MNLTWTLDFGDLIVRFEDNKFKYTCWFLFLVGTIISLLIILNMVIAVMSSTFEEVQEENDAYVRREKLMLIQENWYRMPESYKKKFREAKYLVLIQVDPVVDSVKEVDSTSYIMESFEHVKSQVKEMQLNQSITHFKLDIIALELQKAKR